MDNGRVELLLAPFTEETVTDGAALASGKASEKVEPEVDEVEAEWLLKLRRINRVLQPGLAQMQDLVEKIDRIKLDGGQNPLDEQSHEDVIEFRSVMKRIVELYEKIFESRKATRELKEQEAA